MTLYLPRTVIDAFTLKPDCLGWNMSSVIIQTTSGNLLHSYILGFLVIIKGLSHRVFSEY